jgi:predicted aconitase
LTLRYFENLQVTCDRQNLHVYEIRMKGGLASMFLTKEEEGMLQGECGTVIQKSMEILVTLGDVFRAERMGRVTSAHVSGVSYKSIGNPGLGFLEEWAGKGALTRVCTTINPCGMDMKRWREFAISEAFAEKQIRIVHAFKRMKTAESLSCTPYIIGNKPQAGEDIAWSESSAVAFANSILGARTNREGGPTALASAITGRTPMFGYHLDEQRKPTHEIYMEERIKGELEYSSLGYRVGKKLGQCVPLFKNLRKPSLEELKALSAGLAASGSVAMYHIYNLTPEERTFRGESYERINVERSDLAEIIGSLSTGERCEHVCIGCPHCSAREVAEIAGRVAGERLKRELWVFTSRFVCEEAKRRGYFAAIEEAGGKVISDTCMVVSPIYEMGVRGILTNSCKAAHYIPSTCGVPVTLKSLDDCIKVALGK